MKSKTDGDLSLDSYWKNTAFLSQKIATGRSRRETNTVLKPVRHCANMMIISKGCRLSGYVNLRNYSGKYSARCL